MKLLRLQAKIKGNTVFDSGDDFAGALQSKFTESPIIWTPVQGEKPTDTALQPKLKLLKQLLKTGSLIRRETVLARLSKHISLIMSATY